jgi:prefoldin alpha subunit
MNELDEKQQELFLKINTYQQQAQQLQQQLQAVNSAINELNNLNLGLDELVGKKDKEIFASIGKGIFAKAKLLSEELTVDIGGKNFVKKSIPETKEILQEQLEKLEDVKKELNDNLEKIGEEFTKILEEAQEQEKKEGEIEKIKK